MSPTLRQISFRSRARRVVVPVGIALVLAAPAGAQDLTFRFTDPSFGGNPFYSDHLLAIANLDRPSAPSTPTMTDTQEDLIAQQLRAQLLSQLSGTIRDAIANAAVGGTGSYVVGNQTISFVRTATETTVTFTNTATGEVNTVVLPVVPAASSSGANTTSVAAAGSGVMTTGNVATGSVSGGPAGLSYTAGRTEAGAGNDRRASAEQALIASSSTGSTLPPF